MTVWIAFRVLHDGFCPVCSDKNDSPWKTSTRVHVNRRSCTEHQPFRSKPHSSAPIQTTTRTTLNASYASCLGLLTTTITTHTTTVSTTTCLQLSCLRPLPTNTITTRSLPPLYNLLSLLEQLLTLLSQDHHQATTVLTPTHLQHQTTTVLTRLAATPTSTHATPLPCCALWRIELQGRMLRKHVAGQHDLQSRQV